jgi:hypothetical protein
MLDSKSLHHSPLLCTRRAFAHARSHASRTAAANAEGTTTHASGASESATASSKPADWPGKPLLGEPATAAVKTSTDGSAQQKPAFSFGTTASIEPVSGAYKAAATGIDLSAAAQFSSPTVAGDAGVFKGGGQAGLSSGSALFSFAAPSGDVAASKPGSDQAKPAEAKAAVFGGFGSSSAGGSSGV